MNGDYIPYQIISTFGYNYKGLNQKKTEVIYLCPECLSRKGSPDKSGHLYVNTKTLKYHCVRCGYSGTINKALLHSEARCYGVDKDIDLEETLKEFDGIVESPIKYRLKIPLDKVASSHEALKYLMGRGFTREQIDYYDMRVGNIDHEFGRIIIPNQIDHQVYTDMYSARTFLGQIPKYHNPNNVKKSEIVFNLHRIQENTPIILVEGVLTAVAAGYHAVASYGKVLSLSQASQIVRKSPSVIYVNYDHDAPTELEDACKLLYSLNPEIPIKEVIMEDDRDAADLSRTQYIECLQKSTSYDPLLKELTSIPSLR